MQGSCRLGTRATPGTWIVSPSDDDHWSMMKQEQRLQVEVYSHGGWWKASNGQTGQVPVAQSVKSPMATVASVANTFGTDGWRLTDLVSAHHNTYLLSFEAANVSGQEGRAAPEPRRHATVHAE